MPPPVSPSGNGYAINGPVDLIIPKPTPGVPPSALPPVMIRPAQPPGFEGMNPLPTPSYQVGGVPLAQTVPVSGMGQAPPFSPLAEVPPPHMVAPWLFYNPPRPAMGPPGPAPNAFQNNYYNNYGQQGYPGYPPGPWGQSPQPPVNQPTPAQPPTPPVPPPEAKTEEPKPEEKPPEAKTDDKAKLPNAATLSDETVRALNKQLNDPQPLVRANGAMDFYKLLESNPDLLTHPVYSQYMDAFARKIVHDPSPLVRQPLLLALGQLPHYKKVPADVLEELKRLSKDTGMLNHEPTWIREILPYLSVATPPAPMPSASPVAKGGAAKAPVAQAPHFGQQLDVTSAASQPLNSAYSASVPMGSRLNLVSHAGGA